MKIKNIKVGDYIEAKSSTSGIFGIINTGELLEVVGVEPDGYAGHFSVCVRLSSGGVSWRNHKNFRKPRMEVKIGDEFVVTSSRGLHPRLALGSKHKVVDKGLKVGNFKLDSHYVMTANSDGTFELCGIDVFLERVVEKTKDELKTLDQSVFDGQDERLTCAAIESDGRAYLFEPKNGFTLMTIGWVSFGFYKPLGEGYDSTNWQNSLIEREGKELTGDDLCRAMLARGDKYVMCSYDNGDDKHPKAVAEDEFGKLFYINGDYRYGVLCGNIHPINNMGEPLTAKEAGL